MNTRLNENPPHLAPLERLMANADRVVGILLLTIGACLLLWAGYNFARLLGGFNVHPDAVLLPFAFSIVPSGAGALLLLAARAIRHQVPGRWTVQWGALAAPAVFAIYLWLSLR